MTLADYVARPWRAHAATLAQPTRAKYAWALEKHLAELVDEPLIAIDAPMVAAHQRLLLDRGATPSTVREVIAKLSGILQIATEHGHIPANPARAVRNVPAEHGERDRPADPGRARAAARGSGGPRQGHRVARRAPRAEAA